ncbi:DUF6492 family protein [Gorillibacterium timonense]|uniref:DUF6492 family protein n=1 Tax=Gorillibacterium timonense TaxID=1689269 RepID=UPI00071CB112|nr:DUF6492 family protein [Gorillibacterium timonense]
MKKKSSESLPIIDVLIPAIEKDLPTLPHVIDALRKQVRHPIRTIHIVSPESSRIRALCRENGCHFVHEDTLLPIRKKDIHYRSARFERSGWLYQQLLKLAGDNVSKSEHYLVIDADTVLLRPHTFIQDGKTVMFSRNWTQPEYRNAHRRLLGKKPQAPGSFVAHYMLFKKSRLADLKKAIKAHTGLVWYQAIIRKTDKTKMFGFSEYETYGHYLHSLAPGKLIRRPTLNRALSGYPSRLASADWRRLAERYRSVSFHKRGGYQIRRKGVKK